MKFKPFTSGWGNDNEFNKKLYDTKIMQGIFERINELEIRIEELEKELGKR